MSRRKTVRLNFGACEGKTRAEKKERKRNGLNVDGGFDALLAPLSLTLYSNFFSILFHFGIPNGYVPRWKTGAGGGIMISNVVGKKKEKNWEKWGGKRKMENG